MRLAPRFVVIGYLACAVAISGCGKDKNVAGSDADDGLATISGFVLNIDDATPALKAKVFLLDQEAAYATTVDGNGQFTLRVPVGEPPLLVVDDADPALAGPAGDWYRMLNFDPIFQETVPASGLADHLLHACPNPQIMGDDSLSGVAVWNHYLGKEDAENGDLFEVTSTDQASIIGGAFIQVNNENFSLIDQMQITVDESDYFVAYIQAGNYSDPVTLIPSATLPGIPFHPGSRTMTDMSGGFLSFVSARTEEITFRIVDTNAARGLAFRSPLRIPVRPQMVSFLMPGAIDGAANKSPLEVLQAAGFIGN